MCTSVWAGSAEIFELTGRSQPQLACQKYWELVHRSTFEGAMQHPNQYYEESRKTFSGHRGKTDRGGERRDGDGLVSLSVIVSLSLVA